MFTKFPQANVYSTRISTKSSDFIVKCLGAIIVGLAGVFKENVSQKKHQQREWFKKFCFVFKYSTIPGGK